MAVYVVQEVKGRNILSAKEFGELKLLLPEGSQIVLSAAPTVRKLRAKLKDFCDEAYLLLIGDPAAIGLACSIASDFNRGRYKCLKWDKIEATYYPIEFDLHNKGEI